MSTLGKIVKYGLLAGLIYGAYKLGQVSNKQVDDKGNVVDDEVKDVEDLIKQIQNKPNKTMKDKDVLDLLKVKLKQLTGGNNN